VLVQEDPPDELWLGETEQRVPPSGWQRGGVLLFLPGMPVCLQRMNGLWAFGLRGMRRDLGKAGQIHVGRPVRIKYGIWGR
jgi:hypothetical protein